MRKHRNTQKTVSNQVQNSNCGPGMVLDYLRADVVDIEALARTAEAAADALPAPANDQRILFGRIQSLATKTCEHAAVRERAGHDAHCVHGGTRREFIEENALNVRNLDV